MGKFLSAFLCLALGLALLGGQGTGAQEPEKKQPPEEKKSSPPADSKQAQPDKKDATSEPKTEGKEKKEPFLDGKYMSEWLNLLKDRTNENRAEAAQKIAKMGKGARPITPALIGLLKDQKDAYGRRLAAYALGYIRPTPEIAAPALIEALNDKDKDPDGVRRLAAQAFIRLGARVTRNYTKDVVAKLKDKEDPDVRQLAAYIVSNIDANPDDVRQPLINAAKKEQVDYVKKTMVDALKKVDPDAVSQVED